jgi:epoxyqueuosine reductase
MQPDERKAFLDSLCGEFQLSQAGWAPFEKPLSLDMYRQWLNDGMHGQMTYLQEHLPFKEAPATRFPFAKGAFVFAVPYLPHPAPAETPLKTARLASYARGADYHHWFRDRLRKVSDRLKEKFPGHEFEAHTDSSPILERDFAVRAGLGWVGKNTCVIHPQKGSFFLLGEILSSVEFDRSPGFAPLPDFCGTCDRCMQVCPTKAIIEPRKLDARKCISYLSIESREVPPLELRDQWGDWLFGCDLCQSVCPWNNKPFRPSNDDKLPMQDRDADSEAHLMEELRWILTSSGKTLEKSFRGTALSRAGSFGLKRNALVVAGNRRLHGLQPEIFAFKTHERLGELADWALQKIEGPGWVPSNEAE